MMSETEIHAYAKARGFRPQTLERWLNWRVEDRRALASLAFALKIGENHLRDLMDWLEEIALRDGVDIHAILAAKAVGDIETDPRLGRADKLKRIKEQIRRRRFPRLAQIEDAIHARIQELKLPAAIRLSVPPGLEGGALRVELSASSLDELSRLAASLLRATEKNVAADIFALLAGQKPAEKRSESLK